MLPLISFETGRRTATQSSGQFEMLRQQMEVWFYSRIGTRPRGQHDALQNLKNLHPRSSEARRESFRPLDKDLSWKSLCQVYNLLSLTTKMRPPAIEVSLTVQVIPKPRPT